jgi:hypothetical protein
MSSDYFLLFLSYQEENRKWFLQLTFFGKNKNKTNKLVTLLACFAFRFVRPCCCCRFAGSRFYTLIFYFFMINRSFIFYNEIGALKKLIILVVSPKIPMRFSEN